MSITKSYNKKTNTYYAYETTYEWSDEKQKKVQRKRCIGQFDPETGEVIPNGKVGRPSLLDRKPDSSEKNAFPNDADPIASSSEVRRLSSKLLKIEESVRALSDEIHDLRVEIDSLSNSDS